MGVLGSFFIIGGIFLFAIQTSSLLATFFFILAVAFTLAFLVRLTLNSIAHAKDDYSICSSANQTGYFASSYDETAVGKTATVLTDLKPGGYITVAEKQYAALSLEGYLSKGEQVKVVGGQEQSLHVIRMKKELL